MSKTPFDDRTEEENSIEAEEVWQSTDTTSWYLEEANKEIKKVVGLLHTLLEVLDEQDVLRDISESDDGDRVAEVMAWVRDWAEKNPRKDSDD